MSNVQAVKQKKIQKDYANKWKREPSKAHYYEICKPEKKPLDLAGLKTRISQDLGITKVDDVKEIINDIEIIEGRKRAYGEDLFFKENGLKYLNTYVKSKYIEKAETLDRPQSNENIKLLEDVLQHVYIEKAGIKDYISFMNVVIWQPKRLAGKALIQRSATPGVGKTVTAQDMVFPVLGDKNCAAIKGNALKANFTPFLDKRYVLLGELGFVKDQSEDVKAWITDKNIPSEVKYEDAETIRNRACFCITTNGYANTLLMFDKRRRLFPVIREKEMPVGLVAKLRKALDDEDPKNTFFADYAVYMRERGNQWDTVAYLHNREDTPSANEQDVDELNKKTETTELKSKITAYAQHNVSITNDEILELVEECKQEYPHLKHFSKGVIQKALDELGIGATNTQKRKDDRRFRARKLDGLKKKEQSNGIKKPKTEAPKVAPQTAPKALDVLEIDRTHVPETEWENNFTPPKRSKCALDL